VSIGKNAFKYCQRLEEISFGKNIRFMSIGDDIFEGCENFVSFLCHHQLLLPISLSSQITSRIVENKSRFLKDVIWLRRIELEYQIIPDDLYTEIKKFLIPQVLFQPINNKRKYCFNDDIKSERKK
jgi:hypothetical protein